MYDIHYIPRIRVYLLATHGTGGPRPESPEPSPPIESPRGHTLSACRTFALWIGTLALAATAAADDPGSISAARIEPVIATAASQRGLQRRIPLALDEKRLYAPEATVATEPQPAAKARAAQDTGISDHLALELCPTPLESPSEAGRSLGHGNVVISLPLGDAMELRTGVRVDYDSSPGSENFEAEAIPTIGVGFDF